MAIGDAVAVRMGAATVNRQPAAGVEEQISMITKGARTDAISIYDGSVASELMDGNLEFAAADSEAGVSSKGWNNMALMITNSMYLRKTGSTDLLGVFGVQTNV